MKYQNIWQNLPAAVRADFERAAKSLEFRRAEAIYRQGDQPKGLYFVESGLVGLVLIGAESGKEHLLRFFKKGQFFGHRALFSSEGYHGSATALETTHLVMIPKDQVLNALQRHPELYRDIVLVLSRELRRCELLHVEVLENQILARVARALVYLKDINHDHQWTRQEIANFCASTVSTVIKAMGELERRGLIRQMGRKIEILDRSGLVEIDSQDAF